MDLPLLPCFELMLLRMTRMRIQMTSEQHKKSWVTKSVFHASSYETKLPCTCLYPNQTAINLCVEVKSDEKLHGRQVGKLKDM